MLAQHAESVVVDSGREALSILLRGERFDCVLSDVMMPELTGGELFERAVAIDRPSRSPPPSSRAPGAARARRPSCNATRRNEADSYNGNASG